jgi:hypothetical protein
MKVSKTAVLFVMLLAVAASPGLAQQMMSIGVKGGLTVSNVSATLDGTNVDTDNRTGYNVAGVLSMAVSPTFSVAVEGQVVGKGFGVSDSTSGVTSGLDLLYLNFPILAVLTLPSKPDQVFAARLFAGPDIGFRMTCDIVPFEGQSGTGVCDPQQAKSLDFGLKAGAGLKIGKGQGGFILDVAFDFGLTDINEDSNVSVKNRAFLVSVGYIWPII